MKRQLFEPAAVPWTEWMKNLRIIEPVGRQLRIYVGPRLIEVSGDVTYLEIQAGLDAALSGASSSD